MDISHLQRYQELELYPVLVLIRCSTVHLYSSAVAGVLNVLEGPVVRQSKLMEAIT